MPYLLNINSRTIHDSNSIDGRCRIGMIREEHKLIFETLDEALHVLPAGKKPTKICSFCLNGKTQE